MKHLLLFFLAITLSAQTSLPVQQIRGVGSASGQIFVVLPSGAVSQAMLDTAFTLDTSGPYPVLRVALQTAVRVARVKVVAGAVPAQAYQLSGPGITAVNLMVFRNGVLQSDGDDYTFSANGGATGGLTGPVILSPAIAISTATVSFTVAVIQPGDIVQLVAII